jgi:hypothetical protein
MFRGRLLAESLRLGSDLTVPDLTLTRIGQRDVSSSAADSQPSVWTFVDFELPDHRADELAAQLARTLRPDGGWYADFRSEAEHVVVFAGKAFRYRVGDRDALHEAQEHGRSVGVPEHQLDWEGRTKPARDDSQSATGEWDSREN